MKYLLCTALALSLILVSTSGFTASAKCVVIEKRGNVLIMDCGERSKGFEKKSKVKIKTDRKK